MQYSGTPLTPRSAQGHEHEASAHRRSQQRVSTPLSNLRGSLSMRCVPDCQEPSNTNWSTRFSNSNNCRPGRELGAPNIYCSVHGAMPLSKLQGRRKRAGARIQRQMSGRQGLFVPRGIWLWFCPSTMGHGHRPSMMEGWVPKGGPLVTGHCLGLPGCLAGAVALCGCARAYSSHCCLQLLYYRSDYLGFSCPSKPIWAAIAAVLVWFPLLGSGQCSLFSEPFRRFHRRCM